MKRKIILLFAVLSVFSAYGQTYIKDGDRCFDSGDYACAVTNYDNAFKIAIGKDKQIAEIKLSRAKWCAEHIEAANKAFADKNYQTAKENYQNVLDSNPKDEYAKSRSVECDNFLTSPATLSVTKENLLFSSTGGSETIRVNTNAGSYSVIGEPSWCTVRESAESFVVTCNANSASTIRESNLSVTAGDKTVSVKITQSGVTKKQETTLSVVQSDLLFSWMGESETIRVNTNAGSYSLTGLPSWCTVRKSEESFVVTCNANSASTVREGNFTVTAGDKTVSVKITQSGVTKKQETTLSVVQSNLLFSSYGGSETIRVNTNAGSYSVIGLPSWCTVQKYAGYFVVTCSANSTGRIRTDNFTVVAGDKDIKLYINQAIARRKCFNCPGGVSRPIGLSLGYVQKQWEWESYEGAAKYGAWDKNGSYLDGIQAGVRIEPLFKYGFGLNTGLFYEYYYSKSEKQTGDYTDKSGTYDYNMNFSEHSLYLPLHLEYRLNFTKKFQLFFNAGPSIDFALSGKLAATEVGDTEPYFIETNIYQNAEIGFPQKRFNASLDFGAGIRLNGLQLNVGMSRGFLDISSNPDIIVRQNKNLTASLSWMAPYNAGGGYSANSIDKYNYRKHGLTIGYISKQWEWNNENYFDKTGLWNNKFVPGFRLGYSFQPQFGYGLGLHTGLNLDTYIAASDYIHDNYYYSDYYWMFYEMAISIPLHIEYRFSFSKNFSLFFETGASIDCGLFAEIISSADTDSNEKSLYGKTDWGYPTNRFNPYLDFAGGFRIKNIQFQIGMSRGLYEIYLDENWKVRQNRNMTLGISWFFK